METGGEGAKEKKRKIHTNDNQEHPIRNNMIILLVWITG